MTETYTCAVCKETYESRNTHEEALEEMRKQFGDVPEEEQVIMCNLCYNRLIDELGLAVPKI